MKWFRAFLPLILGFGMIMGVASTGRCQVELFPFIAEITADGVNMRAGQSAHFEQLHQLNKGDRVIVEDKQYSWYKVRLPYNAASYISDQYVKTDNNIIGEVIGNRVNVRAGADSRRSILAQAVQGDQLYILEHIPGWYKIKPVQGSYGWISEQYVEFSTSDVSTYAEEVLTPAPVEVAKTVEKVVPVVLPQDDLIMTKGFIRKNALETEDQAYQLVVGGKTAYRLVAPQYILDEFVKDKVEVHGILIQEDVLGVFPALDITKIQLVL